MLMGRHTLPAYNVQTAVDPEHTLIVAHDVVLDPANSRCLQPMATVAKKTLGLDTFNVVADAGYSNGEQASRCEAEGMVPFVPVMRTSNNQGDSSLFNRKDFRYDPNSNTYSCPGGKPLTRKGSRELSFKDCNSHLDDGQGAESTCNACGR